MSSHHFVREGQEPALFVVDPIPFHLVSPLLEWAPLVLVSYDALDYVLHWCIKIDAVLVKKGLVKKVRQKLFVQEPVEVISYDPHESLLRKALDFLMGKNQAGVNISAVASNDAFRQVGEFSGRLQINLFDEKLKWLGISSGVFEKWLPANTDLWIRKDFASQAIQFQGLKEENENFATVATGIIKIWSDQLFWVGERQR